MSESATCKACTSIAEERVGDALREGSKISRSAVKLANLMLQDGNCPGPDDIDESGMMDYDGGCANPNLKRALTVLGEAREVVGSATKGRV